MTSLRALLAALMTKLKLVIAKVRLTKTNPKPKPTAKPNIKTKGTQTSFHTIPSRNMNALEMDTTTILQKASPRTGFRNTGNVCYMNSVVQLLLSDDRLIHTLHSRFQSHVSESPASRGLISMYSTPHDVVLPSFREAIAQKSLEFLTDAMQDAHEYIVSVFDVISSESQCGEHSTISGLRQLGYSLKQCRLLQCKGCNVISTLRDEVQLGLSLSILSEYDPDIHALKYFDSNLQEMLDSNFENEEIERRCPVCEHSGAILETFISEVPRCLLIQIKRFSFDLQKINASVSIPDELLVDSMTADCKYGALHSYKLKGIISHISQDMISGHYVALIQEQDGTWTGYNDAKVLPGLKAEELDNLEGYIVLYMLSFSERVQMKCN